MEKCKGLFTLPSIVQENPGSTNWSASAVENEITKLNRKDYPNIMHGAKYKSMYVLEEGWNNDSKLKSVYSAYNIPF